MNHVKCGSYAPQKACDKDTYQAGSDVSVLVCVCGGLFWGMTKIFSKKGNYVSFRTDVSKQNSFIITDTCMLNVREFYSTSNEAVKKYFQVIQAKFDPAAFANAPKPADPTLDNFVKANGKCAKGKALSPAELVKKFVNQNMIKTATREGKKVEVVIGKYVDSGIQRTCVKGVCSPFSAFAYAWGGEGSVRLVYDPANGPDKVDIVLKYYWPSCQYGEKECMTHLECLGFGPSKGCAEKSVQTVPDSASPGDGTYFMPTPIKTNVNTIVITNTCFQIDYDYYYMTKSGVTTASQLAQMKRAMIGDLDSSKFVTDSTYGDASTYYNTAKEAGAIYSAVLKEKVLTKQEIVDKFFTKDNIEMASLQNALAKKVVSMYQSSHIYKSCRNGLCEAWKDNGGLAGRGIFGGDGLIALDYDTRAKKLSIRLLMNGTFGYENQQHFMCEDIGDKVTKCSVPPRVYTLQKGNSYDDRSYWTNTNLIQGEDIETNELYVTKTRILHVYKYFNKQDKVFMDGVTSSNNLLITYSASLDDFANPDKGNCLSKAKVDDVMASKDAFLKRYVIVLQRGPVTELIQKAPYPDIESAVKAIKGIGFKNVLYISRKYDFTC